MFWPDDASKPHSVWTENDAVVFTHIMYLDVSADTILRQSQQDKARKRQHVSEDRLEEWLHIEKQELHRGCYDNKILFSTLRGNNIVAEAVERIMEPGLYDESLNTDEAIRRLDSIVSRASGLKKMLVFDADKTLPAEDTGFLFWRDAPSGDDNPLNALFKSKMGYSY